MVIVRLDRYQLLFGLVAYVEVDILVAPALFDRLILHRYVGILVNLFQSRFNDISSEVLISLILRAEQSLKL